MGVFIRLAWQGVRDLFRRPLPFVLTVAAAALTGYLCGLFVLVLGNLDAALGEHRGKVQLQAYWKRGADPETVERQWQWMRELPGLVDLRTFTPREAMEALAATLGKEMDTSRLAEDNPLPYTALLTFRLDAEDEDFVRDMLARLRELDGMAEVHADAAQMGTALTIGVVSRTVIWPLVALLTLLAALSVGNTVKLALLRRADEVEILRLVGARAWYIRLPFLAGGAFQGLAGGVIGLSLLKLTQTALAEILSAPPVSLPVAFLPMPAVAGILCGAALVSMAASFVAAGE